MMEDKKVMRSLVISRFRPGRPDGGGALRNLQNIRALGALGEVDVLTVSDEEEEHEDFEGVREWRHVKLPKRDANPPRGNAIVRICRSLSRKGHSAVLRYLNDEAVEQVGKLCGERRYDLAVVEELSLARYVPVLQSEGCRVVFDAHNVEGILRGQLDAGEGKSLSHRVKTWICERLLRQGLADEERSATRAADLVWACSEADRLLLQECYGVESAVVPNCLRVEDYARFHHEAEYGADWSGEPVRMLFIGRYGYYPNEDAALRLMRDILPQVRDLGRPAKLVLVGMAPTQAMWELAQSDPDVEVTGGVESVAPYLEAPCIATFPLAYGSGTRLKILEAFAAARAVVTTAKGAEGIEAKDGQELFLREDPEEFARAVVALWDDAALRARICRSGIELLREKYSWQVAEKLIRESIEG